MVKEARRPFWSMLVLLIISSAYNLYLIWYFSQLPGIPSSITESLVMVFIIETVLLVVPVFVYAFLKRKIVKRNWVTWHIVLSYAALIMIQLVYFLVVMISSRYFPPAEYGVFMQWVHKARQVLFWTLLLSGNLFFIATIAKGLSPRKQFPSDANDSPHILDEFTS
jgi:hypothetical protein